MPPSVRRGVCSRGRASTRTGRHFPPPSIFVEEPLNFLRAGRFCQRQRQQDGCLLRTQVVCDHHVGLVPIVVANDAPFSNPRALHHKALRFLTISPSSLSRFPGEPAPTLAITIPFAPAATKALASPGRVPVWNERTINGQGRGAPLGLWHPFFAMKQPSCSGSTPAGRPRGDRRTSRRQAARARVRGAFHHFTSCQRIVPTRR
jgi:hypothetical protein